METRKVSFCVGHVARKSVFAKKVYILDTKLMTKTCCVYMSAKVLNMQSV